VNKKTFGRKIRNLIAAFRGLPPEESISSLKRAKPISETISALLKKFNVIKIIPEQVVQENWDFIVGKNIANHCHPVKILNNDVLIIHSSNAVVCSELQMQRSKILENLHKLPRCARISDIRFIVKK
jgi:predicted nucleic acid-binding Zn ribbon protein